MSEGDTKPIKASQVKAGNHILHDGDVYIVKSVEKSKAGKHGHAKARIGVENVITGNKKSLVMPGDDKLKSPIINKKIAQVLAVNPDSIQLMDQENYETFETLIPDVKEIGGILESGDLVDLWEFMGKRVIKRKRPSE
ncbi:MAG: translation initiation factor IF-5A [Candidatus Kariarchaeaceae archaeon]|jgi:translation initiation factor 5A